MKALFIIAKFWKQQRCLIVGEWINYITPTQWPLFSTKK